MVTLGAILPQVLHTFPVSLDFTSIFPLTENLAVFIICPCVLSVPHPYISRPFSDVTFLEAFSESFVIIPVCSIVAEMTNTSIVLLQVFINIFKGFFPQVSFMLLSLLIAVFRLNQLLVRAFKRGKRLPA